MAARSGNTTVDARVTGVENDSKPGVIWSSACTVRVCSARLSLDWVMMKFCECGQEPTEVRRKRPRRLGRRAAYARVDESAALRRPDGKLAGLRGSSFTRRFAGC